MADKQPEDLEEFLDTLKLHNKDLDVCFNDALAVAHTKRLIDSYITSQVNQRVREVLPEKKDPTVCTAGWMCDADLCCGGEPYENKAYNQAIKDIEAKLDKEKT